MSRKKKNAIESNGLRHNDNAAVHNNDSISSNDDNSVILDNAADTDVTNKEYDEYNSNSVIEDGDQEEEEDVYKLFLFYPDGIEDTKKEDIYKLTDAEMTMDALLASEGVEDLKEVRGRLKTTYFFEDSTIGDIKTWRYKFYDVSITSIHFDSMSNYIIYDIVAGGFDVQ